MDDFGLLLLSLPEGLPQMLSELTQKNWHGSHAWTLLRQSVMNVRMFEGASLRVRSDRGSFRFEVASSSGSMAIAPRFSSNRRPRQSPLLAQEPHQ